MVYRPRRKRNIYTSPENKSSRADFERKYTYKKMAKEINADQTSIQQWVKQYKEFGPSSILKKGTHTSAITIVDAEELARLKAIEIAYEEQKIQVEILKKFQTFLKQR